MMKYTYSQWSHEHVKTRKSSSRNNSQTPNMGNFRCDYAGKLTEEIFFFFLMVSFAEQQFWFSI